MFSVKVNKVNLSVNSLVKVAAGFAAITLLSACGNAKSELPTTTAAGGEAAGASSGAAQTQASEVHYDFEAREDLRVKPVNFGVVSEQELVIPAGTAMTVLETKLDDTHGTLVRLGLKVEAGSSLPSDAWFLLDDTLLLALQTKESAAKEEAKSDNSENVKEELQQ